VNKHILTFALLHNFGFPAWCSKYFLVAHLVQHCTLLVGFLRHSMRLLDLFQIVRNYHFN